LAVEQEAAAFHAVIVNSLSERSTVKVYMPYVLSGKIGNL
jgi:hypothetical protein